MQRAQAVGLEPCGFVDLITDIPLAAEIVERMVTAATRLLAGASNKYRISHGGSEPRGEWDALYYSGFVGLAPHCRHLTVWGTDFRPAWRSASSSIWASVARYAAAFLSAAVRR